MEEFENKRGGLGQKTNSGRTFDDKADKKLKIITKKR